MTKVVIMGNCQAHPSATMLREVASDWSIKHWTVFLPETWAQADLVRQSLLEADIIITQPISDGFAGVDCLSTSWIRENKRPETELVIFPVFYYRGQHPGMFNLRLEGQQIEILGTPYHDVLAVKAFVDTGSVDDAYRIAMDGPLLQDLMRVSEWSLQEFRRRESDDKVAISSSGYIEEHYLDTGLFHCFNHPSRPLLTHQLNGILASLGRPERIAEVGFDHLQFPHFPASPALGTLVWSMENPELVRTPAGTFTRADYYLSYLSEVSKYAPEQLNMALSGGEGISEFFQIISQ